ncbi:hypothetical protein [Nonomuraea sp. SBT364]|uniref:hypothetical protein n=1 Tax=Nonomuraea sp. SBT364 TaxID=1580530 RepID=UPI00066A1696|nr:hypothetical protein [Nonomuraea sp. SBT364]
MSFWDESSIVKSVVDRGITEWKTMAGEQERECTALIAEVQRCLDAQPWGAGAEGKAFLTSHIGVNGGPETVQQCKSLLKEIADAGEAVRVAVENTLQAHADMAADMRGRGRKAMEV